MSIIRRGLKRCVTVVKMMSNKYRKKPVIIEAFQMTKERHESNVDWPEWLHRAWNFASDETGAVYVVATEGFYVATLEGAMKINVDDYIIRGIKGELYPCKPDIFRATYEPVPEQRP